MTTILDGRALSKRLREELTGRVATFVERTGVTPRLDVVLIGDHPASASYIRSKDRAAGKAGIESHVHRLPADTPQDQLHELIDRLNADDAVHGILVQLPLPESFESQAVLDRIRPTKDVDAFHPENVGLLVQARERFLPCTPHGVLKLLEEGGIDPAGQHVVVVGRSEIVGKPLANLLASKRPGGDATVTICHSRTRDLPAITRQADILVAAIGRPRFVTAAMVREGATVIDVGINRIEEDGEQILVGDVDFEAVKQVAGAITPAPGGVGPMTITMLLENTLRAAELAADGSPV